MSLATCLTDSASAVACLWTQHHLSWEGSNDVHATLVSHVSQVRSGP
jgi:hypothetical protein